MPQADPFAAIGAIEPTAPAPESLAQAKLEASTLEGIKARKAEEGIKDQEAERELRKKYAGRAFWFAVGGVAFWALLLIWDGCATYYTTAPPFSDKVLMVITTATSINLFAAFLGVIRGLFPSGGRLPKGKHGSKRRRPGSLKKRQSASDYR